MQVPSLKVESHQGDLNSRPADYKSAAQPG
jgi:hypothetical protein